MAGRVPRGTSSARSWPPSASWRCSSPSASRSHRSRSTSAGTERSSRTETTMNVEVVTIGDELLLGFTVDTNAAHLARELAAAGIGVARRATVGDGAADIAAAVKEALDRTGAVITTGGLGPTSDDLSKPAIAG